MDLKSFIVNTVYFSLTALAVAGPHGASKQNAGENLGIQSTPRSTEIRKLACEMEFDDIYFEVKIGTQSRFRGSSFDGAFEELRKLEKDGLCVQAPAEDCEILFDGDSYRLEKSGVRFGQSFSGSGFEQVKEAFDEYSAKRVCKRVEPEECHIAREGIYFYIVRDGSKFSQGTKNQDHATKELGMLREQFFCD